VPGHALRACESEGRSRKDDHRDQPRCLPRRGGAHGRCSSDLDPQANATSGLGGARGGEIDVTTSSTAPRLPRCSTDGVREPRPCPVAPRPRPAPSVELAQRGRTVSRTSRSRSAVLATPTIRLPRLPAFARAVYGQRGSPPSDQCSRAVQAEYYALEGLSQLVKSVELVRARLNPRLRISGVLLTDGRRSSHGSCRWRLPTRCAGTRRPRVPHDDPAIGSTGEAPSHGPARDRIRRTLCWCGGRTVCARRTSWWSGVRRWRRPREHASAPEGWVAGSSFCRRQRRPAGARADPRRRDRAERSPAPPPLRADATAGLAESIRRQGLLQPVVVRPRRPAGTS
jgi:hypothetical protein